MKSEVICSLPSFLLFCCVFGLAIVIPQGILLADRDKICDCDGDVLFQGYGYINKTDNTYFKYLINNATNEIDIIVSNTSNCTYFSDEIKSLLIQKRNHGVQVRIISTFDLPDDSLEYKKLIPNDTNMHIFMAIADNSYLFFPSIADLDMYNNTDFIYDDAYFQKLGYNSYYDYYTNYMHLIRYSLYINNCSSLMADAKSLFEYYWKITDENIDLSSSGRTNKSINSKIIPDFSFPRVHRLREKCTNDDFYQYDYNTEPFFFEFLFSPQSSTPPGRRSLFDAIIELINEVDLSDMKIVSSEIFPSQEIQESNENWKMFERVFGKNENLPGLLEILTSDSHYNENIEQFNILYQTTPSKIYTMKMSKFSATYIIGNETVIIFPSSFASLFDEKEQILGFKIKDAFVISDVIYILLRQHKDLFYDENGALQY